MRSRYVPFILFFVFLLHEAWTSLRFFVPDPHVIIYPFPFLPDYGIPLSTYISLACGYLIITIFTLFVWMDHNSDFTKWFFWLSVLEFFEYFLTYNEALFFIPNPIFPVPLNVTVLKLVVIFCLLIQFYYQQYNHKWNLGK